jgi:hypothetical protein
MPGIPREVIGHHLKIYPNARPVQQKPQKQSIERQNFICEELKKLLIIGFIWEVHHPCWLANPVVIPRSVGNFGCASTTPVSTRHALKIPFLFHE